MSTYAHKKQPKALFTLFLTEMWERFSYYGMRSLLVLYMVKQLDWSRNESYLILGAYATLVYLSNIAGGWLADQFLGFRRAILIGGITITCGHILLTVENQLAFFMGLGLVLTGTGLFKANITTFLGDFYEDHDPRREAGYTIFYMGINVGSFIALIACGIVAEKFGWHTAFGLAAIGMILGMSIFLAGKKNLEGKGEPQYPKRLTQANLFLFCLMVPLFSAAMGYVIYNNHILGDAVIPTVGGLALIYSLYIGFKHSKEDQLKIYALLVLTVFVVMFLAFWEQMASSLTLFTEYHVDRTLPESIGNLFNLAKVPASSFPSLDPLYIMLFAGLLAYIWERLAEAGKAPYAPMKFVIGFIFLSVAFSLLSYTSSLVEDGMLMSMTWLALFYLLYVIGELCLMPVGFAIVTKLAPKDYRGYFMGVFFLGIAFAQYGAAQLAKLTSIDETGAQQPPISVYSEFFNDISIYIMIGAAVLAVFSFIMRPVFRKVES